MRALRQIKLAVAGQLAPMSHGLALIMEHQRFVSPHVLPVLCDLREEVAPELGRRSTEGGAAAQPDLALISDPRSPRTSLTDDRSPLSGQRHGATGPHAQAV
jgi:hypothetical protein